MHEPKNPLSRRTRRFYPGVYAAVILISFNVSASAIARTIAEDKAQQFIAQGDLPAAVVELRNAARENPQDPTIHLRLAELYLRLGNNADAEREAKTAATLGSGESEYLPLQMEAMLRQRKFGELLSTVPADDRAPKLEGKVRQTRALAYMGQHDFEKALASLRDAVRLDPEAISPQVALARVLVLKKAIDEADTIVNKVIQNDPRNSGALQIKAQILQSRGDWDGALRNYNAALDSDPMNIVLHLDRANLYLMRHDTANADADLNPLLASNPNNPVANYLRALELAQNRQFNDANTILTKIHSAFPDLLEGYYLQGAVEYAMGQLDPSKDNLTKYVARVPNNVKAIRLLAAIAMKQGTPAQAINYLEPLAQQNTVDAATLSLLGSAYMADGKPDLAMAQFDAAAKLAPENAQLQTRLAVSEMTAGQGQRGLGLLENVYEESEAGAGVAGPVLALAELRIGHAEKAAEIAQALVAKDKDNPVYQTLLGLVQFARQDYSGAEATLKSVVKLQPTFVPATLNLAQVYIATGRLDEARQACEALIARKPGDVTVLLALANLAVANKDWKGAVDYINRARSAAPDVPKPSIELINLLLRQQSYQDARSTASALLGQFPTNPDVLDAEARVQLATGDVAGAATTYRRAFEAAPTSVVIRNRYLAALRAANDYKGARDVLSQALVHDPNNLAIKEDLIRVEADIGGIDAAIAKAHEFAAQDPHNSAAYDLVCSELYEKTGQLPEAIALLEKAGGSKPPENVMLTLARLYFRAGKMDKAEALLKTHIDANPGDIIAQLALASQYLQRQELDKARQEYERIVANSPASPVALNNLAWLYQQNGDIAKAREMAERAIALAPQDAAIADTLGSILMSQGDNDEALKYLKMAGALSRDPDIQYHLAIALERTGQTSDAKALLEKLLGSGVSFKSAPEAKKRLQDLQKG